MHLAPPSRRQAQADRRDREVRRSHRGGHREDRRTPPLPQRRGGHQEVRRSRREDRRQGRRDHRNLAEDRRARRRDLRNLAEGRREDRSRYLAGSPEVRGARRGLGRRRRVAGDRQEEEPWAIGPSTSSL